jgi:succinate dehydrogenase / fumarate reductase cytochrome b subunit
LCHRGAFERDEENGTVTGLLALLDNPLVRKWVVGLTGLGLVLYTVLHLAGNLAIFGDPVKYNGYAAMLHGSPLLIVAEVFLYAAFAFHVLLAVAFTVNGRKARGHGYKVMRSKRPGSGNFDLLSHRLMIVTGLIVLGFLIVHVWQLRLTHQEGIDLHAKVVGILRNPAWGILYFIGSILTGWHIYRGFQSAFRSMGFHHPRYTPWMSRLGILLAVVLGLGFAAMPIWALATKGGM